jgi:hypothetical protein
MKELEDLEYNPKLDDNHTHQSPYESDPIVEKGSKE